MKAHIELWGQERTPLLVSEPRKADELQIGNGCIISPLSVDGSVGRLIHAADLVRPRASARVEAEEAE